MKKSTKSILFFCPLILCLFVISTFAYCQSSERYFYQLKIYHLKDKTQEKEVDEFLQTAYVPALHRAGIENVGVFTPVEAGADGLVIYVFIPFRSLGEFQGLSQVLHQDQQFLASGSDYLEAPYDKVPYDRIESILLHAFTAMPSPALPELAASKSERVYELRSYEGPTEKYYATKVKMFIEGDELSIFDRLGFNAVFYAEVLSGPRMPNLMYMTSFNNMTERDAHWEAFNNDAAWKTLKAMEEYQHSVSKADIILLHPTTYSDF